MNKVTEREEIIDTLTAWLNAMIRFRRQARALSTIVGTDWIDGTPFGKAVGDLSDRYTETVSKIVGSPLMNGGKDFLCWHATDNYLGEIGILAMAPGWSEPRHIRTVYDLADFIIDSRALEENGKQQQQAASI